MKRFLLVIEQTATGYSAYSPDVPGCIATGKTLLLVQRNMQAAIEFHLEGLKASRKKLPQPTSTIAFAEVAA